MCFYIVVNQFGKALWSLAAGPAGQLPPVMTTYKLEYDQKTRTPTPKAETVCLDGDGVSCIMLPDMAIPLQALQAHIATAQHKVQARKLRSGAPYARKCFLRYPNTTTHSDTSPASVPRHGLTHDGVSMPLVQGFNFWNLLWILETMFSFPELKTVCPDMSHGDPEQEIFTPFCKYLQYIDYLRRKGKSVGGPFPIPMSVTTEQEIRQLRLGGKLKPIVEFMPSVVSQGSIVYRDRWIS